MRLVLQRVRHASVSVDGEKVSEIAHGLLLLVGLEHADTAEVCLKAAAKVATLRVFSDDEGKMNLDVGQVGGQVLAVSQFTLAASTQRGRRPSFDGAMSPEPARQLFDRFVRSLEEKGLAVRTGRFQCDMQVELLNDGPVTLILEF